MGKNSLLLWYFYICRVYLVFLKVTQTSIWSFEFTLSWQNICYPDPTGPSHAGLMHSWQVCLSGLYASFNCEKEVLFLSAKHGCLSEWLTPSEKEFLSFVRIRCISHTNERLSDYSLLHTQAVFVFEESLWVIGLCDVVSLQLLVSVKGRVH